MTTRRPDTVREWAPHPRVAARTERQPHGRFVAAANGTRSCAGGWQFEYANWLQLRPYLYGAFTAPANVGSLTAE